MDIKIWIISNLDILISGVLKIWVIGHIDQMVHCDILPHLPQNIYFPHFATDSRVRTDFQFCPYGTRHYIEHTKEYIL